MGDKIGRFEFAVTVPPIDEIIRIEGKPIEMKLELTGSVWVDQAIDNLASALKTYRPTQEQLSKIATIWRKADLGINS